MKKIILSLLFLYGAGVGATSAGLFHTDAMKAFSLAKKENKPLIVLFFGIWCPPCNELEETVFESTRFLEKARSFVLLKVDADAKTSWKIKDRFRVGAYPTVVFAGPSGDEVLRVVGYRGPEPFVRLMEVVLLVGNRDLTKACKSTDPEDLWRCAGICSEREDDPCAQAAFLKLKPQLKEGSFRELAAQSYFLAEEENLELRREGYERLMTKHLGSPHILNWIWDYLKLFENETKIVPRQEILRKVEAILPGLEENPEIAELGFTRTDVIQTRAELLGKLGDGEKASAEWNRALKELEKLADALPKGHGARGFTLERIHRTEQAGKTEDALKLVAEYRNKYPDEFTFHYEAASILFRSNRYSQALPASRKAYEVSYGDNRIRSATLLMKILISLADKGGARKLYRTTLSEQLAPEKGLHVRTHRYLKEMESVFKGIEAKGS